MSKEVMKKEKYDIKYTKGIKIVLIQHKRAKTSPILSIILFTVSQFKSSF